MSFLLSLVYSFLFDVSESNRDSVPDCSLDEVTVLSHSQGTGHNDQSMI